jgi:hypothetical protein
MATRTIKFREWLKQVVKHATGDGFLDLAGYPIADVAHRLKVSEQRVRQLIEADRLDTIQILTWKGNVAVTLVTEASLEAFEPRAPGRPVQLSLTD